MGRLTTHILDTANGCPASGVTIKLFSVDDDGTLTAINSVVTNSDGRCDGAVLDGDAFGSGVYELQFHVGAYFMDGPASSDPVFLDIVPVRFGISAADEHYHVPLLISPFGYSTYRGS
ncbi:MAG: hydroxyisourate hydrolase [Rhodospirillaceae bacterium]|nr:MAG: hydroxyisourate hydrolase [Rhodospirillaceae bacterium]